jgi:predicted Zn finger-like uncharacterized protein
LLDSDIQQIRKLHKRGETTSSLALLYERPQETIRAIVTGRSYRWVPQIVTSGSATCPRCETWERAARNMAKVRDVMVEVECAECETSIEVSVEKAYKREGLVRCEKCARRRS